MKISFGKQGGLTQLVDIVCRKPKRRHWTRWQDHFSSLRSCTCGLLGQNEWQRKRFKAIGRNHSWWFPEELELNWWIRLGLNPKVPQIKQTLRKEKQHHIWFIPRSDVGDLVQIQRLWSLYHNIQAAVYSSDWRLLPRYHHLFKVQVPKY